MRPWRSRAIPPPYVPIHSDPSAASETHEMNGVRSAGAFCRSLTTNRTPSNRTSPSSVPIQRYPSRVCTIASTVFCGSPVSLVQTERRDCVSARVGSSARAFPAMSRSAPKTARQRSQTPRCVSRLIRVLEIRTSAGALILHLSGMTLSTEGGASQLDGADAATHACSFDLEIMKRRVLQQLHEHLAARLALDARPMAVAGRCFCRCASRIVHSHKCSVEILCAARGFFGRAVGGIRTPGTRLQSQWRQSLPSS
jgi:hypothetical protein